MTDQELRETIGSNIRRVRLSRRMTQGQVAFRMKTDVKSISKIENGKTGISIKRLIEIALALKTHPGYLLP